MRTILKDILLIGQIVTVILFIYNFIGLKKLLKDHERLNPGEELTEEESRRYEYFLNISLATSALFVVTAVIKILLYYNVM